MKWSRLVIVGLSVLAVVALAQPVMAQPFGLGVFGENIPFGAATSLSMNITGSVDLQLTPSGQNFTAADSHDVLVTSTDVVGYKLYTYALSNTSLVSSAASIPASANVTPAVLALNSWGYNIDGSSNYVGMQLTPREIKAVAGPRASGDTTTVTYGVYVPQTTPAGSYASTIVYTAVPETF